MVIYTVVLDVVVQGIAFPLVMNMPFRIAILDLVGAEKLVIARPDEGNHSSLNCMDVRLARNGSDWSALLVLLVLLSVVSSPSQEVN